MSAAPCDREARACAGLRAASRRLLVALVLLVGLGAAPLAPARAAPPATTATSAAPLRDLAVRDLLQLPMATVQRLSAADKVAMRARIEEARARQRLFEHLSLPRASTLPPSARAALPEVAARVVALDLARRRRGLPPLLYAERRGDSLELLPSIGTLFTGLGDLRIRTEQLVLADEHASLAGPIAHLIGRSSFINRIGTDKVRVEVLPSVPFGVLADLDGRVIYMSALLVALALPEISMEAAAPLRRELGRRDLGTASRDGSRDDDDNGDDGSDGGRRDRRDAAQRDAPPCILGTLCIACTRDSCQGCGCERQLNSCCAQCDRMNRDCTQCSTGCGNSCTRCNNDCTRSCNSCNSSCARCGSDCSRCGNDCNKCNSECSRCSNDCNRCSNDCSRCGNDCNKCNSDCSRCGNDCSRCGGGCNECQRCQLAVPLMPPPLPEPEGAALLARATRDSILLTLPPLLFLFLRRRLLRKKAAGASGSVPGGPR